MQKIRFLIYLAFAACLVSGCASFKQVLPRDSDSITQAFFEDLQRSKNDEAYSLFAKGLAQRVSFDQFDGFMQTLREQWGHIQSYDIATMPFHRRIGEQDFIPLNMPMAKIKRYVFDVKFDNAEMNFDLTLSPEGDGYKIVWFSVWGSSIYITPQIKEKIEQLFSGPDNPSS